MVPGGADCCRFWTHWEIWCDPSYVRWVCPSSPCWFHLVLLQLSFTTFYVNDNYFYLPSSYEDCIHYLNLSDVDSYSACIDEDPFTLFVHKTILPKSSTWYKTYVAFFMVYSLGIWVTTSTSITFLISTIPNISATLTCQSTSLSITLILSMKWYDPLGLSYASSILLRRFQSAILACIVVNARKRRTFSSSAWFVVVQYVKRLFCNLSRFAIFRAIRKDSLVCWITLRSVRILLFTILITTTSTIWEIWEISLLPLCILSFWHSSDFRFTTDCSNKIVSNEVSVKLTEERYEYILDRITQCTVWGRNGKSEIYKFN